MRNQAIWHGSGQNFSMFKMKNTTSVYQFQAMKNNHLRKQKERKK